MEIQCVQINMNDKCAIFGKVKVVCKNEGQQHENNFVEVHQMVTIGPSTITHVKGVSLTNYACHAIMGVVVDFMVSQNAIPSRKYLAFFKMNIETFDFGSQVVTSRGW